MSCERCNLEFCPVLNLRYDCEDSQLRNTYRRLAQKFHPDSGRRENDSGGDSKIKQINNCYSNFSNFRRRVLPRAQANIAIDRRFQSPGVYLIEE